MDYWFLAEGGTWLPTVELNSIQQVAAPRVALAPHWLRTNRGVVSGLVVGQAAWRERD